MRTPVAGAANETGKMGFILHAQKDGLGLVSDGQPVNDLT